MKNLAKELLAKAWHPSKCRLLCIYEGLKPPLNTSTHNKRNKPIKGTDLVSVELTIKELHRKPCDVVRTVTSFQAYRLEITVEDLARSYRGTPAMETYWWDTHVKFAALRVGDEFRWTEWTYTADEAVQKEVYYWYANNRYDQWNEEAQASKLNRDRAVHRMSHGTPEARAEVAVQYLDYLPLVEKDQYYDLFLAEIQEYLRRVRYKVETQPKLRMTKSGMSMIELFSSIIDTMENQAKP